MGDKLTAFAPNMTGIPYNAGKHIEIVKQLHDVGKLADHMTDMALVAASFHNIAVRQIGYRKLGISPDDVCNDIIATALMIAREARRMNTVEDIVRMAEIQRGINGFQGFLTGGSFRLNDAIAASAKAALLAAKIKAEDDTPVNVYDIKDIAEGRIENIEYNYLNRLQKINREAFHYWRKTLQVLKIDKFQLSAPI